MTSSDVVSRQTYIILHEHAQAYNHEPRFANVLRRVGGLTCLSSFRKLLGVERVRAGHEVVTCGYLNTQQRIHVVIMSTRKRDKERDPWAYRQGYG